MMRVTSQFASMAATLVLAGCVVGPNYDRPPAVIAPAGTFQRADAATSHDEPVARWWLQLQDPQLDRLVEAALASNPSVDVAKARLRQARATLSEKRANELPSTGSSAAYVRSQNLNSLVGASAGGGGGGINLYSLAFDATWEIDLFGGKQRAAEGAAAAADGTRANLADVLVSLSAEVAQAYIQLRDAQQRLALTLRNIEIETRVLELIRVRRAGGTASDLDVERVANQLETTQATLGPLKSQIFQQLNRLAVLTAHAPGELDAELSAASPVPAPPERVEIGDPSSMLRRRPDIAMAERKLAQQTAGIGQNMAALFPKVNLLGDVGFASLSPAQLFNGSSFTYAAAPILQWTPWDFGRTRARIAEARAARDEAEADYRRTVLGALEDAETSLSRYGQQRDTVGDLARVQASAKRVYELTDLRLRGGTASTTDVLDADTRRVQAELNYQQALAQLSEYYVALQKSLGLGWLNPCATPPCSQDAPSAAVPNVAASQIAHTLQ
jgi:multidrug efflux system outer membrane protein